MLTVMYRHFFLFMNSVFSGSMTWVGDYFPFLQTLLWVCALESVWVVAYKRPPARCRGGGGKSYLHPVKLFLIVSKFHQMAFLNRLQSERNHRTCQTTDFKRKDEIKYSQSFN